MHTMSWRKKEDVTSEVGSHVWLIYFASELQVNVCLLVLSVA